MLILEFYRELSYLIAIVQHVHVLTYKMVQILDDSIDDEKVIPQKVPFLQLK